MGFFDVFKTIGSGISSAVSTVGHGISKVATGAYNSVLKPVYNKVLKPVYNSVIKPIGKPIVGLVGKVFSKGEALVDKGLDFSGRFIDKTGGTLDNLAGGAFNLSKLLENPFVMLGAGILGLVVVSKM